MTDDRVPPIGLLDDRGEHWELRAPRDQPLLLIFHRHFY